MHFNHTPKQAEKFWEGFDKSGGENACWNWTKKISAFGYGQVHIAAGVVQCHRFVAHLCGLDTSHLICHSCDNRRCGNPEHLWSGTHLDNNRDALEKGRATKARGADSGMAKLDERQVSEIRSLYIPREMTQSMLAKRYGVKLETIQAIIQRKTWRHLP